MFVAIILYLLWQFIGTFSGGGEIEQPEELLNQISEHRTYIVNQWLGLLGFWLGVEVKSEMVKMTMPDYNLNLLYFYNDNMEVATYFDWGKDQMIVKVTLYSDMEGYWCRTGIFSMRNKVLDNDGLYKFIRIAQSVSHETNELTAEDVVAVAQEIKNLNQPFQDDAAAKRYYFNVMADLIMVARKKKFRRDKRFMKIYASLFHYMWNTTGEEFIEFLNEDEPQKEESTEE